MWRTCVAYTICVEYTKDIQYSTQYTPTGESLSSLIPALHWTTYNIFPLQDAYPLGEIFLGPSVRGYWVDEDVPHKLQHYTNIFMLHTPARSKGGFPLLSEDASSKEAWITALQEIIRGCRGLQSSDRVQCQEDTHCYVAEEELLTCNVETV